MSTATLTGRVMVALVYHDAALGWQCNIVRMPTSAHARNARSVAFCKGGHVLDDYRSTACDSGEIEAQ